MLNIQTSKFPLLFRNILKGNVTTTMLSVYVSVSVFVSLCFSVCLSVCLSLSPPPPPHTYSLPPPPPPPPPPHTHKQRNKATTNQTNKQKTKKTKRHKKRQRKLTVDPQAILNGRSLVVCAQNTVGLRLLKKSSTGFVVCQVTAELCDRYSVARRSGTGVVKWPLLSHYPNRPYPLVRDPIVLHNSFFSFFLFFRG